MPDLVAFSWRRRYDRAVAKLREYLANRLGVTQEQDAKALQLYQTRRVTAGWRLKITFPDQIRRLDLLLDEGFPYAPPLVAVVERPPPLTWPHIEDDGVLCLLPSSAAISHRTPVEVVQNLLRAAAQLVDDCVSGVNQNDFLTEFLSYWERTVEARAVKFRSLVTSSPPSRTVRVWRGQRFYLLGEDDDKVLSWLRNFFQDEKDQPRTTGPAAFLWFDQPIHPQEYPRTAADVWSLAKKKTVDGAAVLEDLATGQPEKAVVLFGAPTQHGPCLGGVMVPTPQAARLPTRRKTDVLNHGFRPGRIPPQVLVHRYFGATSIVRSAVARVDPAWVHGRGQDPRQPQLHVAKVAIIGCGSVGGPITITLAKAGVGQLILIDPERLVWANVGRHPLGAGCVGDFKATALATRIKSDYPHITSVEAYSCRWQELTVQDPNILTSCDLIVSAIGHWNAEGALNEWYLSTYRHRTIVYGWTEPYACAGHAVAVAPEGGCLHCGFTECGEPLIRATDWPTGETRQQEPACGVTYQPYGPVELTYIEALIGELVIDCLMGATTQSRHRVWVTRRTVLEAAGGTWHPSWTASMVGREEGGFIHDRLWPSNAGCSACQRAVVV